MKKDNPPTSSNNQKNTQSNSKDSRTKISEENKLGQRNKRKKVGPTQSDSADLRTLTGGHNPVCNKRIYFPETTLCHIKKDEKILNLNHIAGYKQSLMTFSYIPSNNVIFMKVWQLIDRSTTFFYSEWKLYEGYNDYKNESSGCNSRLAMNDIILMDVGLKIQEGNESSTMTVKYFDGVENLPPNIEEKEEEEEKERERVIFGSLFNPENKNVMTLPKIKSVEFMSFSNNNETVTEKDTPNISILRVKLLKACRFGDYYPKALRVERNLINHKLTDSKPNWVAYELMIPKHENSVDSEIVLFQLNVSLDLSKDYVSINFPSEMYFKKYRDEKNSNRTENNRNGNENEKADVWTIAKYYVLGCLSLCLVWWCFS